MMKENSFIHTLCPLLHPTPGRPEHCRVPAAATSFERKGAFPLEPTTRAYFANVFIYVTITKQIT
jgi:hypothetical protein